MLILCNFQERHFYRIPPVDLLSKYCDRALNPLRMLALSSVNHCCKAHRLRYGSALECASIVQLLACDLDVSQLHDK